MEYPKIGPAGQVGLSFPVACSQTQTRKLRFAGHTAGHFIGQFHFACNRKTGRRDSLGLRIELESGGMTPPSGCWVLCIGYSKPRTQHPEPGTQNPAPRTRHPEPGTQNPAPRTRHPEPMKWGRIIYDPRGISFVPAARLLPGNNHRFNPRFERGRGPEPGWC